MSDQMLYRLQAARKDLLDLGLRNPLINHSKRAKQVRIVDELACEVHRILAVDGVPMHFVPLPDDKIEEISVTGTGGDEPDWAGLLAQPEEDNSEPAARHVDTNLQTALESSQLQKRLLSIHADARSYLEEQGVNVLYVAVGFLHWLESSSSTEARRAPLILIPVRLDRASAQERFSVTYTGDDIAQNLSLAARLKSDFAVEFPDVDSQDGIEVDQYFGSVRNAIDQFDGWRIEENEITLGFFSFGKFLMYQDLNPDAWPSEARGRGFGILAGLLGDGLREPASLYGDSTHIDEVIAPADVHQILDADSSQILAILDANAGRNLVLQGPPGTGKSQTITNIIAECIGNGRTVLFVAEKMAALEVVKARLDQCGIGDAALELHSNKTNKKRVLAELGRTLNLMEPRGQDSGHDIRTLTELRDQLNAYSAAVNNPIGNTKTSFVRALGLAIQNDIKDLDGVEPFSFGPMSEWNDDDFRSACFKVDALDRHLAEYGSLKEHPLRWSELTEALPSQRSSMKAAIQAGQNACESLASAGSELATSIGLENVGTLDALAQVRGAAGRLLDSPDLTGIATESESWVAREGEILELLDAGKSLAAARAEYDEWLIDAAWIEDLIAVRQCYVTTGQKWWRWFSMSYRRAKARMRGLCRKPLPKRNADTVKMIDVVISSQERRKTCERLENLGAELLGPKWRREHTDWAVLEWVMSTRKDIESGTLPGGLISSSRESLDSDDLTSAIDQLNALEAGWESSLDATFAALKINDRARLAIKNLPLLKQAAIFRRWHEELPRLSDLVQYRALCEELRGAGLEFVVSEADEWADANGPIARVLKFSWYAGLVERGYSASPELMRFDRANQEHRLEQFNNLDHLLFQHNRGQLVAQHWKNLSLIGPDDGRTVISREINKKRRHLPVRKLIREACAAVQAIKPVFMMSPMSIATYLPPGTVQFDLVVFDEASQMKPVDAFGAIMRGKQVVVVGDSKQLPPTQFFDREIAGDDADEDEQVGDMESILGLCLGKGAPQRVLRWHYRSRHESLIAVSNHEFYDNKLVVFPSPGANPHARGLRLRHLPDTAYDRGKTRSNPGEAKHVAHAVFDHAREHPDLTLGVVAFSSAQRDAIVNQLELLRREDQSCEAFFREDDREPFFVKNLENVQGDERDVIFISVGYGRTADGYLTMKFGPLNSAGGERRLNVLITRARCAMDVFTNLKADDIDLERSSARGVSALKTFLAYAETGVLQQPYSTGGEPDSPFEEAVIRALQQRGVEVEPQVGTAGFFIDIGVKHPTLPGKYILGIECDGATYHSSRSARDRDRLRQEVLENLGWRLHRIWSTEWYRNPDDETERALAAIERALLDFDAESPAEPKVVIREGEASDTDAIEANADEVDPADSEETADGESVRTGASENHQPQAYQRASLEVDLQNKELHQLVPRDLAKYVEQVVAVESPVHESEVCRRITEGAGLNRAGRRIQEAVTRGVRQAVQTGAIRRNDEFLWSAEMTVPAVRNRCDLESMSRRFEYIAPEEIAETLMQVVQVEVGPTSFEWAADAAIRRLGFKRATEASKDLFRRQINALLDEGRLEQDENGLLVLHRQVGLQGREQSDGEARQ